ncbi:expressed protein [Dictyostelium purpureum]|uniref:Expressed protein n=1 Tax=Dictyostelium purpureum TaxID=5786 RepID=F0ZL30_DICPU|nr:uncharacterized protein DICPUDRAFT_97926 [Dictyostelium purpureum]EGC35317.1 expressed protein [Dictyostelium purpureum]|eukprot:XP_003288124.1 expressed protein [Dictyostelium purpureum]
MSFHTPFLTSILLTGAGSNSSASATNNEDFVGFEIKSSKGKECGKADSLGFSFSYNSSTFNNIFNSSGSSADNDCDEDDKEDQNIISIGFDIVWDILSPTEPFIDLNTCKNFFSSILNNFLNNYI